MLGLLGLSEVVSPVSTSTEELKRSRSCRCSKAAFHLLITESMQVAGVESILQDHGAVLKVILLILIFERGKREDILGETQRAF